MKKMIIATLVLLILIAGIVVVHIKRPHLLPYAWTQPYSLEECGGEGFSPKTLEQLNTIRSTLKKRYRILSGYRSKKKNKEVGGVPNSKHINGIAIDLWVPHSDRAEFYEAAKAAGFKAFGWGNSSVHIDTGAKRWWTYDDKGKSQRGKEKYKYLHKAPENFKKDFKIKTKAK